MAVIHLFGCKTVVGTAVMHLVDNNKIRCGIDCKMG